MVFIPETKDKSKIAYRGKGEVPEINETVKISAIRIYQGFGYCVSLENYGEELFFPLIYFRKLDYDFVDDIIKQL